MFDYIRTKIQYWKDTMKEIDREAKEGLALFKEKHPLCGRCKFSSMSYYTSAKCSITNEVYTHKYPCKECKYFKEEK